MVPRSIRKIPTCCVTRRPLPCSQNACVAPYYEPVETTPSFVSYDPFEWYPPSACGFQIWSLPLRYLHLFEVRTICIASKIIIYIKLGYFLNISCVLQDFARQMVEKCLVKIVWVQLALWLLRYASEVLSVTKMAMLNEQRKITASICAHECYS